MYRFSPGLFFTHALWLTNSLNHAVDTPKWRTDLRKLLDGLQEDCTECGWDHLADQVTRLKRRMDKDASVPDIKIVGTEMLGALQSELLRHHFYCIPKEWVRFYPQNDADPIMGTEVATEFPDAAKDISEAGRCLALNRWTAAVFHLMRVLEYGIQNLAAAHLGAPQPYSEWGRIIEQLEKKIEVMTRGPEKQRLGECLGDLRTAKNAWRNHVNHARTFYDQREANDIWNGVSNLMHRLASQSRSSGQP